MARARRLKREEWRELTAAWATSGMSGVAFAQKVGVNPHTFAWWRCELGREERCTPSKLSLVPVRMAQTKMPAVPLDVVLPNGLRVRVPSDANLARVRDVVNALRGG